MHGEDSRNFNWPEKTILVLGNEGQGPSAFLKEQGPAITLAGDASKMESLNVAVSGATLLYAHACSIGS
jgi:tRNA G18 (ribose-2'-O)-methylase SpoU